jgi:AraC-like DNA-binding protein
MMMVLTDSTLPFAMDADRATRIFLRESVAGRPTPGSAKMRNFVLVKREAGIAPDKADPAGCIRTRDAIGALGLRRFRPHPVLSDLVEDIWDWDLPDFAAATNLSLRMPPSPNPMLVFQYRVPLKSDWDFGSANYQHPSWRHVAVKMQSGIVTIRPVGPIGTIIVRLRPEAAGSIMFAPMQQFMDTKIHLHDLFNTQSLSRIEEALTKAQGSTARIKLVEDFLSRHARPRSPNPLLAHAASRLRSDPSLQIQRLASQLDISERHLSRGFKTTFGSGPKHFARLVRVEKAVEARRSGSNWSDIAYGFGFADQAHLVRDFNAITGAPPEEMFRKALADNV